MRDIRPELRERLEEVKRERARLDRLEAGIKALLKLEDEHAVPLSIHGNGAVPYESGSSLKRFLLDTLRQAKSPLTIDDFKVAAQKEGITFGKKAPGRVLHRAMTGMIPSKLVERAGGKWRLIERTQITTGR